MSQVVDPVEAVNGTNKVKTQVVLPSNHKNSGANKKESDFLFSDNYIIAVMKLTDLSMKHQSNVVKLRGELADVVTRIQSDLSTINQFMSNLQSQAHSGGLVEGYDGGDMGANDPSGLNRGFYHVGDDTWENGVGLAANYGSDYGNVSSDYQSSMQGFTSAVKDLFFGSPAQSGQLTVADISKIDGPYGTSFELNRLPGFWGQIAQGFSQRFPGMPSDQNMISSDPTMHPSLVQQYIYYSAQMSVSTCSKEDLMKAGGDITKIPGVDFNPMDNGFDPTLNAVLGVFSSLDVNPCWNGESIYNTDGGSIINLIDDNSLYNTYGGDKTWDSYEGGEITSHPGTIQEGLYMSFATLAYNYYWTKNPNASDDTNVATNDSGQGTRWWNEGDHATFDKTGHVAPVGDPLSAMYMSSSSAQSTLSSASSNTNTNFQQDTSSVQTVNNAAQQMVQSFSQGQGSTIQNFKG